MDIMTILKKLKEKEHNRMSDFATSSAFKTQRKDLDHVISTNDNHTI